MMKKRKQFTAPQKLLAAIIYLALVGVVIYGTQNHVYDGFGSAVPWVIGAIFLIMAGVRVYDFIVSYRAEKSVKAFEQHKSQTGESFERDEH